VTLFICVRKRNTNYGAHKKNSPGERIGRDQADTGHMELLIAQAEPEEIPISKEEEKGLMTIEKEMDV
jgi:hypothetical protein